MRWIKKHTPGPAADLGGFALVYLLLAPLSQQFQDLGVINSVWMGLFFLVFCLSVYGLKKLRPTATHGASLPAILLEKQTLGGLGVIFALAISTATAYVVGFLDSVVAINRGLLDEPSVTIYLLLTPASWFGLALIYVLVLTNETEPTVKPASGRYVAVSFLSLAGVNLMGVVFTAVWQALWQRFTGVQDATFLIAINFVLYAFLIGPPRLIYFSRSRSAIGLLTLVPFLLYLAFLATP